MNIDTYEADALGTSTDPLGGLVLADLPSWMASAACADADDPSMWFPSKGESGAEAIEVCRACAVRGECLDYALEEQLTEGVFGGLTPGARKKLTRERRRSGWVPARTLDAPPAPPDDGRPVCECGRTVHARGLCMSCYRRDLRERRGSNAA